MQTYLTNLAQLAGLAKEYSDARMTAHIEILLALSTRPKEAWEYWQCFVKYFSTVAEPELLQEIEDYLKDKARD